MKTVERSFGEAKKIRGIEIKRMPLGAYLRAVDKVGKLPAELLRACFPGEKTEDIHKRLQAGDSRTVQDLLERVLRVAPGYVLRVVAELLGVEEARLMEDEAIGLDGLMELMEAWVEVNGLVNFTQAAKRMAALWKTEAGPTEESRSLSPEPSESGSPRGSSLKNTIWMKFQKSLQRMGG